MSMNDTCKNIIESLTRYGSVNPSTLMKIAEDLSINSKDMKLTIQIGIDQGLFEWDKDFKVSSKKTVETIRFVRTIRGASDEHFWKEGYEFEGVYNTASGVVQEIVDNVPKRSHSISSVKELL